MTTKERPQKQWLSRRAASVKTSMRWTELRPLLKAAGVDLFRPTPRRELVDAEGLDRWMRSCRVPTDEERLDHADVIRARVLDRMAARRTAAHAQ